MFWTRKKRLEELNEKIKNKSKIKRYFSFFLGCFTLAIAFNLFLAPNDIVSGGVGGISNEFFPINKSIFILATNLVLLAISYKFLGVEKTKGSILGSLLFPVFVELTANINQILNIDNKDLLLAAIFAGVLYGFGSGIKSNCFKIFKN